MAALALAPVVLDWLKGNQADAGAAAAAAERERDRERAATAAADAKREADRVMKRMEDRADKAAADAAEAQKRLQQRLDNQADKAAAAGREMKEQLMDVQYQAKKDAETMQEMQKKSDETATKMRKEMEEEAKVTQSLRNDVASMNAKAADLRKETDAKTAEMEAKMGVYDAELQGQKELSLMQLKEHKHLLTVRLKEKQTVYDKVSEVADKLKDQVESEQKAMESVEVEQLKEAKVVILLGMTGSGKSTFSNRMCGDTSEYGDEGASEAGSGSKSVTQDNSTQIMPAKLTNGDKIAVVDTPGVSDSFGGDRDNINTLCKFLTGCGGINAFVLVRNGTKVRFDMNFQMMLTQYENMFGRELWDRLIVVATHVEGQTKKRFRGENLVQDIGFKFKIENVKEKIKVIAIGATDYGRAIGEFVAAIPAQKREFNAIKSPLNDLIKEHAEGAARAQLLADEIAKIKSEIKNVGRGIEKQTTPYKVNKRPRYDSDNED